MTAPTDTTTTVDRYLAAPDQEEQALQELLYPTDWPDVEPSDWR